MNQKKDVLKQVVRLGRVSQDSIGNSTHDACVAAKKNANASRFPSHTPEIRDFVREVFSRD